MIAFALLKYPADTAWSYWIVVVVLYQVILAIILGVVIGYGARRLLRLSERGKLIDKESFLSFEIALAVILFPLSKLSHHRERSNTPTLFSSYLRTGYPCFWGWMTS